MEDEGTVQVSLSEIYDKGYRAGIREVVEDIVREMSTAPLGLRLARFEKLLDTWQAKLKEVGVKIPPQ